MKTIGVTEARRRWRAVLDLVAAGKTVVIERRGVPWAKLRPYRQALAWRLTPESARRWRPDQEPNPMEPRHLLARHVGQNLCRIVRRCAGLGPVFIVERDSARPVAILHAVALDHMK